MLAHLIAVFALAVLGFELYRTIDRLGAIRPGVAGRIVSSPLAHLVTAVLFLAAGVALTRWAVVPPYVGPIVILYGVIYGVAAIRAKQRGPASLTPRPRA
jgi:hypothetical protein